jgi:CBS domain-containing protein
LFGTIAGAAMAVFLTVCFSQAPELLLLFLAMWLAARTWPRWSPAITPKQNQLAGIITRGDIVRALRQKQPAEMTVLEAGSTDLVVAFPDEPLHAALTKMLHRGVGRLPVVERNHPTKVVGYLGRAAILSARMKIHEEENVRQKGWPARPTAKASLA